MPDLRELYDVAPVVVRFVGGHLDGREMINQSPPDHPVLTLCTLPPQSSATALLDAMARAEMGLGPDTVTDKIILYRFAGIADDGAWLYRVGPRARPAGR